MLDLGTKVEKEISVPQDYRYFEKALREYKSRVRSLEMLVRRTK